MLMLMLNLWAHSEDVRSYQQRSNPADVKLLSGGPDGFGYTYLSTQDGDSGVTFNWVEIRDTANDLRLADDDFTYIPLPFSFPFYDTTYDTVTVGSNGLVYFEPYYIGMGNTSLPSSAYDGGDIIAVFWDDLSPQPYGTGSVYFKSFTDSVVIEWDSVPIYGQTTYNTFEVILYADGRIKMQYLFMNFALSDATIGIQDSSAVDVNPTWYLQYVYNGSPSGHVPDSGTAVLFVYPTPTEVSENGKDDTSPSLRVVGRTLYARSGSVYDATGRLISSFKGSCVLRSRGVFFVKAEGQVFRVIVR